MHLLTKIILLIYATAILAKPERIFPKDASQPTPIELIESFGYPAETHRIQTEDNYILTAHRIPHGINNKDDPKIPLLLVHGLSSSSADWVPMGPTRNLPYILADEGYDVWLLNSRGNSFSRNHTMLDPSNPKDQEEFFNFSWHEMGYYDLPAAIDHILEETEAEKIQYVGHSQGGTSFLVMAATRPEYNDKIQLASLFAPASILAHEFQGLNDLSEHINEIDLLLKNLHIYELPLTEVINFVVRNFCPIKEFRPVCGFVLGAIFGGNDEEQMDWDNIATISINFPSKLSIKQVIHYGQEVKAKKFQNYDYGTDQNMIIYGQATPPEYDLSKITAPVSVYYGLGDHLVSFEDCETLISRLSNVVKGVAVPYENFSHLDFIIARDVVTLFYNDLVQDIKNSQRS